MLPRGPALRRRVAGVTDFKLKTGVMIKKDDRGNVGKRYRYQDEQGTPWCITVDFDTLGEKGPELQDTVTLRDRDTMKQERVALDQIERYLIERLPGC